MNSFKGKIIKVNTSNNMSLVDVAISENIILKAIVVDTPRTASYLSREKLVKVLFKETEVVLGTNTHCSISIQNKIKGIVKEIKKAKLLSRVVLRTEVQDIVAVISTAAIEELSLEENVEAVVMIKLNEIMISE